MVLCRFACRKGDAGRQDEKPSAVKTDRQRKISATLRKFALKNNDMVSAAIKNGELPKCWGHYVHGHKCDCPCAAACQLITYDNMAERSRQRKWENFLSTPLNENIELEDAENDSSAENPSLNSEYSDGLGKLYDASEVDLTLVQTYVWLALESPETAKALMMKLNPNVRSFQDMADILGITKQAIHKRIATELGIGQRNLRTSLLRLHGREIDVYRLCIIEGMSQRNAAKKLRISHQMVGKYLKRIREKGFTR